MIRLLLEFLLPLLAPTLLYGFWLAWRRGRQPAAEEGDAAPAPASWGDAPWIWLGGIGVVLVAVVAIVLGQGRSLGDAGGIYVAPRVIDGQVVPGHVDPPPRR
jgi:hypothetical protein